MARLQEDVRRLRFWRSIIAELVGSLFVVLIGCGAFTETLTSSPPESTHSWLAVKVALAFGLTYAALLYCFRNVNDAHLNPSVTVALLVTRRSSVIRSLLFLVAQLLGGIVGAALLLGVTAGEYRSAGGLVWPAGCTRPAEHVTEGHAFGVEFFATFFFVFVVVSCYDRRPGEAQKPVAPFIIGLTYVAVIVFAFPYTGGSVNTARSFGPAVVFGVWDDHWVYWFGPLIGGVCGGALYEVIFSTKSSFQRITACFTVFNKRDVDATAAADDDDGSGAAAGLKPDADPELGAGGRQTTCVDNDELEELGETKTGTGGGAGDEIKPRHKLFVRPKFSCCGGDRKPQTTDSSGGGGGDGGGDATAQ